MPNLVGIWDPDLSKEQVEATLARQLRRVRVPCAPATDHVAALPGFGMALQDNGLLENGPQPAVSEDGNTVLFVDGEINNASELQRQFLHDVRYEPLPVAALCLRLLLGHGPSVARHFNGLFCLALYDRAAQRLTLVSDHYGARALFYVQRGRTLLFATEIKALAAVDPGERRIDETGSLELFCYGSHFMDRTSIDGYLHIAPASILTVDTAGLSISRYWTYRYDEGARTLDQQTYAAVFGILLDRAVERRMSGGRRIGLFLSGGYDSRSVAAAIRKHHLPLPAFTFGLPESRDVRFGTMLAQRLGLEHRVLTWEGPYLYPNCRAIVWRTEGMIPFANATSIQLHATLKERMDIILTGFLGEFSGSHTWPRLLLASSRRAAVEAIFGRFVEPKLGMLRRIFEPGFFARAFESARDRFYRSFDLVENEHPLNIADSWNVIHLQPRGTFHAPSVDRHAFEMRAPHTDNELVDFLLSIPPYQRLEQRVYKRMIAESFPLIRDVPCTNSGRPIEPNFAKEYVSMVGSYALRKLGAPLERLRARPALGREFRDLNEHFRREPELADRVLRPLLRDSVLPASVFSHEGVERVIAEHYSGAAGYHDTLALLVSWGLAAKYFLHDDLSDVPPEMHVP